MWAKTARSSMMFFFSRGALIFFYMLFAACTGVWSSRRIDLEVHSQPGLNASGVVGEALARYPLLTPVSAGGGGSSSPIYIRSVAPSLSGIAASSAAFWNQYLSVGGGGREIILDIEARSFSDSKVGTASCWFDHADGNRECLLRVDASFAYSGFVMLHEMAHAVLLWSHVSPLCVYDSTSTERCIDDGGHWSPHENGEVLSPYVGDTMFVSEYTILAASSSQSGGVGVTGLCDGTCVSGKCSENHYFTSAPRVCADAHVGDNDPGPLQSGGGGGGSDGGCGGECIGWIAGGGGIFLVVVGGITFFSMRTRAVRRNGYSSMN